MINSDKLLVLGISIYLLLILNEHILIVRNASQSESNEFPSLQTHTPLKLNKDCMQLPPTPKAPRVYLHIGPAKTGTTSIQDYLACNTEFLKDHNTHYLGKVNPNDIKKCGSVPPDFFRPLIQYPSIERMEKLREMMIWYQNKSQSVIISSENVFDIPKDLTDELFANMALVFPVIGYRRYYDWLLSSYRFNYEPKWYDIGQWRSWDGHESIPTFRSFISQHRKEEEVHPTLAVMQNYTRTIQQSTSIKSCPQILNVHAGDVTQQFMTLITGKMDSLPISVHTNVNDEERKLYWVDAEILALKLHSEGRLALVLTRRIVVNVLQHKMSLLYNKNVTPPLDCLSTNEEEALLKATKLTEKQIVPEFFSSPLGEAALETEFRDASDRKVFCNINFDEMLKDQAWDKVLLKLKSGRLQQSDFSIQPNMDS